MSKTRESQLEVKLLDEANSDFFVSNFSVYIYT